MTESNEELDLKGIVRKVLGKIDFGSEVSEEKLEALADSIISDLELDGVINEAAEARNLETIRGDLQNDSQVFFIDLNSGDADVEALEQLLFGL